MLRLFARLLGHKTEEERLISSVSVLELKPGDILILSTDRIFSAKQFASIRDTVTKTLRVIGIDTVPILILEDGMKLSILRSGKVNWPDYWKSTNNPSPQGKEVPTNVSDTQNTPPDRDEGNKT